ncbi:MAG: hypothetical protein AAF409_08705 [Pseudomonadota bacterium]
MTTITVDESFRTVGGAFDSGPVIYVVAKAVEIGGLTGACALWTTQSTNGSVLYEFENAAQAIRLDFDGETLIHGVSSFPRVSYQPSVLGETASCKLTDRPWQKGDEEQSVDIVVTRYQNRPSREVLVRFGPAELPTLTQ